MVVKAVLSVVFTFVMILALGGVYYAHYRGGAFAFGTIEGSLSVLALVLTIIFWTRHADSSEGCPIYLDWITLALLIVAFVLSILDLAAVHLTPDGTNMGTQQSALSIVTFAFTAKYWAKHVQFMHGHLATNCPSRSCAVRVL